MKRFVLSLIFLTNIISCKNNKTIPLYSYEYNELVPLLNIDEYNKLIKLKASFPLFIYSPKCSSSCSLFPLYFNNYLKEENVFFPIIYENIISKVDSSFSGNTYLCIISKGNIIDKKEITYFNDHEIRDYISTYTKKNNISIINDISFFIKEDDLSLSNFVSYNEKSKLSPELVKNNDVLIINDNLLNSFDKDYYKKIESFKYIYFSSYLNDSFYLDFNVNKNDNVYNLLSYKNNKFEFSNY